MKKSVCLLLLLAASLALGLGDAADRHCAFREEDERRRACAYLERLEASLEDAETVPMKLDAQTGSVIEVHGDSPTMVRRVRRYLSNAVAVQRVKSIPALTYPLVYLGDSMTGNYETLYYAEDGTITAFSLCETDRLAFLLYLTGTGAVYPEVKAAYSEGVIKQLEAEIAFGPQDILTYCGDELESIEIKTPETAHMLFQCIQNCVQIIDLTDADLEPMALPVEINGRGTGTFEMLYVTYEETGQILGIVFSPKDAADFRGYVAALREK